MKKLGIVILLLFICLTGCEKNEVDNKNGDLYEDYNNSINEALSKIKMPLVKSDLSGPRLVTSEDIVFKDLSKKDIPSDAITNVYDIIGLCIKENVTKHSDDYFYENDLIDCNGME